MHLTSPVLWITLTLLLLSTGAAAEASTRLGEVPPPDAQPMAVVAALESALIESMRASEELDYEARREALEPIVTRVLDVPQMGRFIFGSAWRRMSEEEQERFIEAFTELSLATYAARFVDHGGQEFEQLESERQGERSSLVRSRFLRPEDEPLPFEYLLRRSNGEWRIVNILADGVSDLAVRRGEYTGAYRGEGMDAVIEKIRDQIRRQADG